MLRLSMRVWDAPTRLFHWAVVALLVVSYVSIQRGWMQIHFLSGYSMMALLLFRLAWGFIGSETSLFRNFLVSPLSGFKHLRGFFQKEPDDQIGHNAAGGWMVLFLLAVLAVQVATGLFSTSDYTQGPLAHLVLASTSDWAVRIHAFNFYYLILGLSGLHVLAILAYALIKKHNLLRPMITGRKRLPGNTRQPRMASSLVALLLVALAGCVVWVVTTRI